MKPLRYAVAPKHLDEWKWMTTFYRVGHILCTSPSIVEGNVDTLNYRFKQLTEAEYESYLEMEVLAERPSTDFAIHGISDEHWKQLQDEQAIHELHELDDVFDQSES